MSGSDDRDAQPTIDERRGSSPDRAPAAEPVPRPSLPSSGRYAAIAEIARGGMGRVVEATDVVLGRTVAVKEALDGGDDALRRFQREIHITARLEHPSIVPVHDAGTSPDGTPFYVMRKVTGRPLTELIARAETIDARLALLPHVVAAAQALAHAHRRGVVHRDIKPANILVGELGETIVIDWGLAKVTGEPDDDDPHAPPPIDAGSSLRTRIGTVFGTPGFMSPEQLHGETVDARADVYALGATLYFLFVREPPHANPDEDAMMVAAAEGPPVPIGVRVPGLPRELSTIIDKALAYDGTARYPDAGALAEDLQRFLTGQLVASHRYSPRERLTRFVRKNRVAVAIAVIALATLVIGSWVAIGRVLAARERADAQARLATARQHDAETARASEQERGDQLLLTQAHTLVDSNPTAAVALLKQLVTPPERWGKRWRQARAIAAAAQGTGVARALRAPTDPGNVMLARDGKHALVITRHDVILYDLDAMTSRPIAFDAYSGAFAGTGRIVMWNASTVGIFELATGTLRTVEIAGIDHGHVSDTTLYWLDPAGQVWRLAIAGGTPERLALGARATEIKLSSDGRWLAGVTDRDVRVVDLAAATVAPRVLVTSVPWTVHWDSHSTSLLSIERTQVTRYWLDGRQPEHHTFAGTVVVQAEAIDDRLYVMTSSGTHVIRPGYDAMLPLSTTRNPMVGLMVSASRYAVISTRSSLHVIANRTIDLHTPTGGITSVGAADARRIVALTPGHLLVWSLDELIPKPRMMIPRVVNYAILDDDHLFVSLQDGWHWMDVARNVDHRLSGEDVPMLASVFTAGAMPVALISPMVSSDQDVLFYVRGPDRPVLRWREHVTGAIVLNDGRAVVANERGELVVHDLDDRRAVWFTHAAHLVDITRSSTWLVAAYADGVVMRYELATGAIEQTALAVRGDLRVQIAADGTAFIGAGTALLRWQRDGLLLVHAIMPEQIESLIPSAHHMLVHTRDGGTYTVTHAAPAEVKALPAGTRWGWFSESAELAISDTADGHLALADLDSGTSWPTITPGEWGDPVAAELSSSGRLAGALFGGDLYVWPIDIPTTAADTARWLDTLTNATAELGTSTLTFH